MYWGEKNYTIVIHLHSSREHVFVMSSIHLVDYSTISLLHVQVLVESEIAGVISQRITHD